MKDAKGHGSDAHQAGVIAATKPPSPWEGASGHFEHAGTASLPEQGFTPTGKAKGMDTTGALRVGWKYAQQIGKPATVLLSGRGGWLVNKEGNKIPYGQSHMTVHPDGRVHRYNYKL